MGQISITPEDQKVFDRLKSTGRITSSLRHLMTKQWNVCSVCKCDIPMGRPSFAGYDRNNNPLFVGACCAHLLAELATPTYWGITETLNISVEDEQTLWRYMDFAKFVAMLGQKGLYFPSACKLPDAFEGATGLARRQKEWDGLNLEYFRQVMTSAPEGYPAPTLSSDEVERQAQNLLDQTKRVGLRARNDLVSCWHANSVESEALWRVYCPPPTVGVAIRTTAGALWASIVGEPSAVVGRVHYVDFKRTYAHLNQRLFFKRLSLSHENEVRAVIRIQEGAPPQGRVVTCDLDALIDKAIVSPFAPHWFQGVVSDVVRRFGFGFEVVSSELMDEPFY